MFATLKNLFFLLVFFGALSIYVYDYFYDINGTRAPRNAADLKHWHPPIQTNLPGTHGIKFKHGQLRFMAEFEVSGRVLGKKYYDDGRYAQIAPMDLSLGWQYMSKPRVYKNAKMHNHNRVFTWEGEIKIPRQDAIRSFANIHIIPANQEVWGNLVALEKEQFVTLSGHLVHYDERIKNRIFMLRTSLTRNDTGLESCELMYVQSVEQY